MSLEDNKNIVRLYQEACNRDDLNALDDLVAPDLVTHSQAPGLPQGLEGGKMAHRGTVAAFPDLHYEIEELIARFQERALILRETSPNELQAGKPAAG